MVLLFRFLLGGTMKNSYFRLVHKEDGTYIRLIPAEDGGENLNVNEIKEYIMNRNITYDLIELNRVLSDLQAETEYKLTDEKIQPQNENYVMQISQDEMQVVMRFYAPSEGGKELTTEGIMADLRARNVRYGIKSSRLMEHFEQKTYCTDIVVAEGKPARQGKDAEIIYLFDVDRKAKPTLREDGSVDFHTLNTICHCKEGDVLARLIPADPGEDGMNIYGNVLKPHAVKSSRLKFGRNIELSEDRTEIRSMVNGHVTLADDRVFVSDILELENVDISTGDITFAGSVQINGNVTSNYTVKAEGDVQINGVVEGARIESGGTITIARGMNGMAKGVLIAKQNIISKFLENAEVTAGGFISTESILHCKVQAGTEVEVTGKKGFITGGNVIASNHIKVKTLGSPLGATTMVEVGVNPEMKREQLALQKQLVETRKQLNTIEPVLMAAFQKKKQGITIEPEQLKYMQQLAITREQKREEIQSITNRLVELDDILVESQNPSVIVTGEVYPGTRISIMDVSMVVKSTMKYCKFVRLQGDVKMVSI